MTYNRRMLNPPKKDTPHPKIKEKPQQDSWRGAVMIKSNPIPTGSAAHNWRMIIPKKFSHCFESSEPPHQASQPGYLAKGLGILRESDFEGQWDLIAGLPQDWGKQIPLLVGTNKILCTPIPKGREQCPTED